MRDFRQLKVQDKAHPSSSGIGAIEHRRRKRSHGRRKAALAVEGYNEQYNGYWGYEDVEFSYRLITQGGCRPIYAREAVVYYREPLEAQPVRSDQRLCKNSNLNWHRIRETIPGFRDLKHQQYLNISVANISL